MMAISTQTEALIELYNQKITLDTQQINQVNYVQAGYVIQTGVGDTERFKVWGTNEIIENYNYSISKLDNQIIALNTEIQDLQNDILNVKQTANSNGCPGAIWQIGFTTTTEYEDTLNYVGYGFTAPNPFSSISGILTTSNAGIGTYNYTSQSSIGQYFEPITGGGCTSYVSQINDLETQVSSLQGERDNLIIKVNTLKASRVSAELQNYAYNQSKNQLNESIATNTAILTFLQDPANAGFL
jgi:outer membrane murein-binding lipoprotein Lpp